jgi:hypothetical protein
MKRLVIRKHEKIQRILPFDRDLQLAPLHYVSCFGATLKEEEEEKQGMTDRQKYWYE